MDLPDAPASDRPTLSRNLRFWLLTMLLGSLFVLLRLGTLSSNNEYLLAVLLITLGLATALSLPWALGARSRKLRWLRLLTLQSAVLGLLVALDYAVLGGHPSRITLVVGTAYFVAGLLAAPVVYAPWLGQPWPTRRGGRREIGQPGQARPATPLPGRPAGQFHRCGRGGERPVGTGFGLGQAAAGNRAAVFCPFPRSLSPFPPP